MIRKIFIGVFLLAVVGTLVFWLQEARSDVQSKERVASVKHDKEKAANFVLPGIDGKKQELIVKGKPTIVHFWTSWCATCKAEFPLLKRLYDRYKDDVQFQMVNVTVEDDPQEARKLIQKENYDFPVLFDFSGEVGETYQIISVPTTYFVDENGKIHKKVLGTMTEKQFHSVLLSMKNG